MVLTAAQVLAFFVSAEQMAIPAATVPALNTEGIDGPDDLAEFDQTGIGQVVDSLRKPGDRIPNPDPGAPVGATIPRPPYVLGAKSQKRLIAASDLIRYYVTTGRALTQGNIQWDPIIKNFTEQWSALKARKDEDIAVPKLSRGLPMLKWVEAFTDFLSRKVGARTIPLVYVIRAEPAVPAAAPALENNKPHSTIHGSVEGELVARASHDHPLFREDNSKVYFFLEEALRGTSYAPSLSPFQRRKDGRSAFSSVKGQYAGMDKWQAELKKQDEFIHNRRWKGQNNFSLEKFIAQHRNAFVSMTQCADHVEFQLPNEYTRVGYLLSGIETSDPKLQAAIAVVESDSNADGKRHNFEDTASYLLPKDPVAARQRNENDKRPAADISGVEIGDSTRNVSAFGSKPGIGKTGVHLRYHENEEYETLKDDQKKELREWRDLERSKGRTFKSAKGGKKKKFTNAKVRATSLVSKEITKQLKALNADADAIAKGEEELEAMIESVIQKRTSAPSVSSAIRFADDAKPSTASALQSILRRVKGGKGKKN